MFRTRPLTAWIGTVLVFGVLVGCGATAPQAPGAQAGPTATPAQSDAGAATAAPAPLATLSPSAAPTEAPATPAGTATSVAPARGTITPVVATGAALVPTVVPAAQTAVGVTNSIVPPQTLDAMRADLLQRLGGDPSRFTLTLAEPVTWPDGSLGCPKPGMMYPQVLVDGFRVVFAADGKEYAYHGDDRGQFFYCENPAK